MDISTKNTKPLFKGALRRTNWSYKKPESSYITLTNSLVANNKIFVKRMSYTQPIKENFKELFLWRLSK